MYSGVWRPFPESEDSTKGLVGVRCEVSAITTVSRGPATPRGDGDRRLYRFRPLGGVIATLMLVFIV